MSVAFIVNIPAFTQESASVLGEEKKAHAADQERLQDMERIKSEIETRMSRLKDLTDELVTENAQLKVDNALLQDEAQRYRAENDELRGQAELLTKHNSDLKDKVGLLRNAYPRCNALSNTMLNLMFHSISPRPINHILPL